MDREDEWVALGKKISSHSEYFNHLVGLVPANVYSPPETIDQPVNAFFHAHKKEVISPKIAIYEKKQLKQEARLATYDPANEPNHDRMEAEEDSSDEDDSSTEDQILPGFSNNNGVAGPTQLQERFQEKMEGLRLKRKAFDESTKQGREKRQKIDERRSLDKTKKEKSKKKKKPKFLLLRVRLLQPIKRLKK